MAAVSHRKIYRFDVFEADPQTGQLRKRGMKVALRDQSFVVLISLLEHPGEVVTRQELRQRLWPDDIFVDFDNLLNTAVARLRTVLGDSAENPRFIETFPRRGYRFIGSLSSGPHTTELTPSVRVRLAVLPFLNLSGDPAWDYLSDGMTDEIITALGNLAPAEMGVIARTTSMLYKGIHKDVASIGQELGVDYVVEGALRCTKDQVAVNVQLIHAGDQTHLFARSYNADLSDIFKMQNPIAQAITAHIPAVSDRVHVEAIDFRGGPERITGDIVAYKEYVQGRHFIDMVGSAKPLTSAKELLEKAISRDPEFAHAHDALAEVFWLLGYFGYMPPREAFSAGILYALRAIEIDNTRAETHALLGQFHKISEYNWNEVEREMTIALELNPNSPLVRMRYAVSWLMPHGRIQEAAAELERALELDPLSMLMRFWLCIMLLLLQDYERAIEEGRKLTDMDPDYGSAYFPIAVGSSYLKRFDDALAAQRKAVELCDNAPIMRGWLGLILAYSGHPSEARKVLRQLRETASSGYVPPASFAWVHLGLREVDAAFHWMDRAVEICDQFMMPIKTYKFLDPIREDPRYFSLLRKMNLDP